MFKETGYTGSIIEEEAFGSIEKEKYNFEKDHYATFRVAVSRAKSAQPYSDASDPDPRFSNDLHATVAEMLNLKDYSDLRIYTAVGSHLDKYHSIDAFFEYDIEAKTIMVSLDITINRQKGTDYKADVVFQMPREGFDPEIEEDREPYLNKIKEVANSVVKQINTKYDLNNL